VKTGNSKITFVMDSKDEFIPLSAFKTALDQLTAILHEVEHDISASKQSQLKWGITQLSLNSPATIGLDNLEKQKTILANRTSSIVVNGINLLVKEKKRPEFFNNVALANARSLAKLAVYELKRIRIYSDGTEAEISQQIATNVTDILENLEYVGSIEGMLEVISGREGKPIYFRIEDIVSQAEVTCYIHEDILSQALQAFRKRVIVSGLIKSDSEGNPTSIRVEQIEILPDEKDLPQVQDVVDALKGSSLIITPYDHRA
jgi:hypothetical protein